MDVQTNKSDWFFLIICIALGVLAELSFFHGSIGVSYLVFFIRILRNIISSIPF
ncbi:hypothetical protein [Virgibacillus sp. DJP39]|uniref:hypothetical protein n=1 Tax=Virgibacillus sp. DJP39 TaxID=3409790 RepID=UPI003BB63D46